MKRHALLVSLLCFSALFFTAISYALTVPVSEDSYTASGNKLSLATNNASSLIVDATRKSYLYFDLSDIPADAVVRWAKLRLFLPTVRTAGAGLSVHLVSGNWNESRLANVPDIVAGSLGTIAPDKMASRRFVTVDVKDTVQKWISGGILNEGFAVQPIIKSGSPTASVMLTSKEGPVFGLSAELDIEFDPIISAGPQGERGQVGAIGPVGPRGEKGDTGAVGPQGMKGDMGMAGPQGIQGVAGGGGQIAFEQLSSSLKTLLSPTITAQPVIPPTSSGSLLVQAQGMGNLSYQWMRNGVAIVGGTNSQLPVGCGLESGTYTVAVSNEVASVTSESVQITIMESLGLVFVSGGTLPDASSWAGEAVGTFCIGKTEVTWGDWKSVRTWAVANGYDLANVGQGVGDNYPVTHVNWYDVVKWCNARSEKEGKAPVYRVGSKVYRTGEAPYVVSSTPGYPANGYRLPSEKEWEFAARGGSQTKGYTYSGSNNLGEVGWFLQNSGGAVHEVGKKLANELGIFDMSGNLLEWSGDLNIVGGSERVLRGGFWGDNAENCTVAGRYVMLPWLRNGPVNFGFRVALSSVP